MPSPSAASWQRVEIPLIDHPQLRVITTRLDVADTDTGLGLGHGHGDEAVHVEYRVLNWRRPPSGRIVRGDGASALFGALLAVCVWAVCGICDSPLKRYSTVCAALLIWTWLQSRSIIYRIGLQLSTTRGFSLPRFIRAADPTSTPTHRVLVPCSTAHTFVPLADIATVVINEGLTRWDVRFFLAVLKKRGQGVVVALDRTRQPVAVLREIYHGVREALYDEYEEEAPRPLTLDDQR